MKPTFAAIDFETATNDHNSACAVGVVVVEDGQVVEEQARLIKPPNNYFLPFHMNLHGITPEQTDSVGSFKDVWPEIDKLIGKRTVVAHNANFDESVLIQSAKACRAKIRNYPMECSLYIARRVWPKLNSHKLDIVAKKLKIDLTHHDPLSDANAAAQIVIKAVKQGYKLGR